MAVQPTLVVCFDTEAGLDRAFFLSLGAKVVFLEGAAQLVSYLRQARPHGVCLVMAPSSFLSGNTWFHNLERRCFFEGLRVAIFLRLSGSQGSIGDLLGSPKGEGFRSRLSSLLAMRDVYCLGSELSQTEQDEIRERLSLSLGLPTSKSTSFDARFPVLVKRGGPVAVSLPGRVSWFDDEGMVNIETSVRLSRNTACRITFAQPSVGVMTVQGVCVEGLQTGLRFNFGSAIKVALAERESLLLARLFATENPRVKSRGQAFRRALTVVKSASIRDKVAQILHAGLVEFRVPLVWRNVLLDVPKLAPHYIILEDVVLAAQGEKVRGVLAELRKVAGPNPKICIIGPTAPALVRDVLDSNLAVFPSVEGFESVFRSVVSEPLSVGTGENERARTWLSADSTFAECVVDVDERYVMAGGAGLVLESRNSYRSLSNMFLAFPGTSYPRAIVKNIGSYLAADGWKVSKTAGRSSDDVLSQFHLLFSSPIEEFSRDVESALQAELDILRERPGRVGQKLYAMGRANPPQGVAQQVVPAKKEKPPSLAQALKGGNDDDGESADEVSIEEVESVERGFSTEEHAREVEQLRVAHRERLERRKEKKKRDRMVLLLILLGLAILVAVVLQFAPSNETIFADSFEKLFQRYGRGE
jgi:hypothetical protein